MSDSAEKAIELAADTVGEVANVAEGAEKALRSLNQVKLSYLALGVVAGAATSALITWKLTYLRAQTKFSKIADEEIAEMRQHYQDKLVGLEATTAKGDLEEMVNELGYKPVEEDEKPPMAVTPPAKVVEEAKDALKEAQPSEAQVIKEPEVRNVFVDEGEDVLEEPEEWDYQTEFSRRSPDIPYVIHYDERLEMEGYDSMSMNYYEPDDVLANARDEVIDPEKRTSLIGEEALERFGHGSGDEDIVFVRNDELEMVIEITRSDKSYAEQVAGFTHSSEIRANLERMRRRERNGEDS